jgi:hypothetical protein
MLAHWKMVNNLVILPVGLGLLRIKTAVTAFRERQSVFRRRQNVRSGAATTVHSTLISKRSSDDYPKKATPGGWACPLGGGGARPRFTCGVGASPARDEEIRAARGMALASARGLSGKARSRSVAGIARLAPWLPPLGARAHLYFHSFAMRTKRDLRGLVLPHCFQRQMPWKHREV